MVSRVLGGSPWYEVKYLRPWSARRGRLSTAARLRPRASPPRHLVGVLHCKRSVCFASRCPRLEVEPRHPTRWRGFHLARWASCCSISRKAWWAIAFSPTRATVVPGVVVVTKVVEGEGLGSCHGQSSTVWVPMEVVGAGSPPPRHQGRAVQFLEASWWRPAANRLSLRLGRSSGRGTGRGAMIKAPAG